MEMKSEREVAKSFLTLQPTRLLHPWDFPGKSTGVGCHCLLIELFNFRFFSITGRNIELDYCDTEWLALEMNRDNSVIFEIASKYCISDSFVDHDGYSISSKGFMPTVVDIMVI